MKEITTIQLSWDEVEEKAESLFVKILGKKITCNTTHDVYDFWGIGFFNYRMNIEEIEKICNYVNANEYERGEAFPMSPDTHVRSFGGEIANKILAASMDMSFQKVLAIEDGLFLIGCVRKDRIRDVGIVQALRNKPSRDNRKLLDAAADEIEGLRAELESVSKISVPASIGKLVAEIGGDPKDYPEIFVYLERKDGVQIDLAVVGQPKPESKDIRAGLYGDTTKDDWTDSYTWHREALEVEVE